MAKRKNVKWLAVVLFSLGVGTSAHGVDGVIEINQASALAGGVTSGDTAGFPVTISEKGSYRLTGNLTVNGGSQNAVTITQSDVTLDLNGFTIGCQGTCSGNGIASTNGPNSNNLTIRNGIVRGMAGDGINVGMDGKIEDMVVADNGGNGISLSSVGNYSRVVVRSTVKGNTGNGVVCVSNCQVVDSFIVKNGARGINGSSGVIVTGDTIADNVEEGVYITSGNITGNTISGNKNGAYCSGGPCVIADNSVSGNSISGIVVASGAGIVKGNAVSNNVNYGLWLNANAGYVNNVMYGNNGVNPDVNLGINLGGNVCNGVAACP